MTFIPLVVASDPRLETFTCSSWAAQRVRAEMTSNQFIVVGAAVLTLPQRAMTRTTRRVFTAPNVASGQYSLATSRLMARAGNNTLHINAPSPITGNSFRPILYSLFAKSYNRLLLLIAPRVVSCHWKRTVYSCSEIRPYLMYATCTTEGSSIHLDIPYRTHCYTLVTTNIWIRMEFKAVTFVSLKLKLKYDSGQ